MICKDFITLPYHEIPNFRFQLFVIKELLFLTIGKSDRHARPAIFYEGYSMTEAFRCNVLSVDKFMYLMHQEE
jgi:hypothetical protein